MDASFFTVVKSKTGMDLLLYSYSFIATRFCFTIFSLRFTTYGCPSATAANETASDPFRPLTVASGLTAWPALVHLT
jgi:hypothetical protein